MSDAFELNAEVREDTGKGASRRLRRLADQIPAILYGGDKPPTTLSLVRKDLEHALENEAFYSHVLTLNVGKKKENLGVRFKMAVQDRNWIDALTVGETIVREFPNSGFANEVRDMLDSLRTRAAGQRAAMATGTA